MTRHLSGKAKVSVFLMTCLFALAVASSVNLVHAQTYYSYQFIGPYYLNTSFSDPSDSVTVNALYVNGTSYSFTLAGALTTIYSSNEISQVSWNASSALNYTSIITFKPTGSYATHLVNIYVPNPNLPFYQYTFQVTDFAGMTNPYLQMYVINTTSDSALAEQVSLLAANIPTFIMQEYQTYTLTITCDQGTYSQQFTAETTLSNSLIVLVGAFPSTNSTTPTANADRLNSTLIGIAYVDPSNLTSALSVIITHQTSSATIYDYSNLAVANSETILWNEADPSISYNINVTSTINGVQYIWVLVAPQTASTNPWLGAWDWLGSSVPTMPYVSTGWPLGMTSGDIAEIVAGVIILFFLSIGSFRSSGATCIVAWIMSGFLIAFGWWGNGTLGAVSAIPEFALSGFIAIMIQLSESKDTVREV